MPCSSSGLKRAQAHVPQGESKQAWVVRVLSRSIDKRIKVLARGGGVCILTAIFALLGLMLLALIPSMRKKRRLLKELVLERPGRVVWVYIKSIRVNGIEQTALVLGFVDDRERSKLLAFPVGKDDCQKCSRILLEVLPSVTAGYTDEAKKQFRRDPWSLLVSSRTASELYVEKGNGQDTAPGPQLNPTY